MSFESPWLLLVLLGLPAIVVAFVFLDEWRHSRSAAWAPLPLQANMVRRPPALVRILPFALFMVALALLAVGFARPTASWHVKSQEATVVLVLDKSGSMAANDESPTRFAAAKAIIRRFMSKLPHGYEFSLVSFSNDVSVVTPPTHDLTQVDAALARQKTGPEGTALMEAVEKAVQVGASVKGTVKGRRPPAVVVVVSDGGQNFGRTTVQQATKAARAAKTPVSTIALGTPNGIVRQKIKGGYTEQIQVPAQPATLQQLARGTGGFFQRGAAGANVKQIYDELGSRVGQRKKTVEVTSGLAAGALAFMLAGGILSGVWLRRVP
ncbi:MAG TPA: VWA domain-containing protein [Gaiellaceae bacterium]|nr:VWA domain-containing protein [Gaiellaceae bacterium]